MFWKRCGSSEVKNQQGCVSVSAPPPHSSSSSSVFVSMPLAPAKIPHKMVKSKATTAWEVITAGLKRGSVRMRRKKRVDWTTESVMTKWFQTLTGIFWEMPVRVCEQTHLLTCENTVHTVTAPGWVTPEKVPPCLSARCAGIHVKHKLVEQAEIPKLQ